MKILSCILFLFLSTTLVSQRELHIFNDSLSITDVTLGIPDVGLGLSGLYMGSGLSESILNPFELRIIQTPLLPFFGSSRLEYNSLGFEFSDVGLYNLDWKISSDPDPLYFGIQYEFERIGGGISFISFPIVIEADTANIRSHIGLRDRVGINVDTVKEGRLTVFSDNDQYNTDVIGAVQAYKNADEVGAAVSGVGSTTGDDKGTVMTTGTLAGFTVNSNVGVYGHALDSTKTGVVGGNGGDHYSPVRWGALGTSDYAVYANGDQFSTSAATWATSDRHLKSLIKSQSGMLDKVMQLSPKIYKYTNDEKYKSLSFPKELQHGFLAQDVEKVFPELVREVTLLGLSDKLGKSNYKAINYNGFISILTTALQETTTKLARQEVKMEDLQESNDRLKNKIESLEHSLTKVHLLLEKIKDQIQK